MTDAIFEAIATGVDAVVSGAIIMLLVYVFSMNTKLTKYSSMQETYSNALTYYREFNAFDCENIHTADIIAASATYSESVDLFGVFVDKSTATITVQLYKRIDGKWSKSSASYNNSTGKISFGSTNTSDAKELIAAMSSANWGTTVQASDLYNIAADFAGTSYLLEDLSFNPSQPYKGGTVTGIYFYLER